MGEPPAAGAQVVKHDGGLARTSWRLVSVLGLCAMACTRPSPPSASIERVQLVLSHPLGPWFVFDVRSDGSFCSREHDGVLDEKNWFVVRSSLSTAEFAKLVQPLTKEPMAGRSIGVEQPHPYLSLRVQTSRTTHAFEGREFTHSGAQLVLQNLRDRASAAMRQPGSVEVYRTGTDGAQRPEADASRFVACIPDEWDRDGLQPASPAQLRPWGGPR